ncbi:hypothetical protein ATANTOWER_022794 [Ataeniobius toweri]|uniref:Uncharacterized protein n=1 Tax=Ataeniobius toweri TaxID=208326 RepID=A0ABU7B1Y5_9TELE|nr:hypothetical protein [Ataeniobius toweri]
MRAHCWSYLPDQTTFADLILTATYLSSVFFSHTGILSMTSVSLTSLLQTILWQLHRSLFILSIKPIIQSEKTHKERDGN